MGKNTGAPFEEKVYELISEIVKNNEFIVSAPNVRVRRKPRYYSKDRDAEIEFDISVEKYLADPDENKGIRPSIIVVIECKDYSASIPVDDVEEFHAKLQQIGADNTKGIMITQKGCFQRSALAYAESKGIALARIMPDDQVRIKYVEYRCGYLKREREEEEREMLERRIRPLIEKDYILSHTRDSFSKKELEYILSYDNRFFSLTEDDSLEELIARLCDIEIAHV